MEYCIISENQVSNLNSSVIENTNVNKIKTKNEEMITHNDESEKNLINIKGKQICSEIVSIYPYIHMDCLNVKIPEYLIQFYYRHMDNQLAKQQIEVYKQGRPRILLPLPLYYPLPGYPYSLVIWHIDTRNNLIFKSEEEQPLKLLVISQLIGDFKHPLLFSSLEDLKNYGINIDTIQFRVLFPLDEDSKMISLMDMLADPHDFHFIEAEIFCNQNNYAWLFAFTGNIHSILLKETLSAIYNVDFYSNELADNNLSLKIQNNIIKKLMGKNVPINFIYLAMMKYIGKNFPLCTNFEKKFFILLPNIIKIVKIQQLVPRTSNYFYCIVQNCKKRQTEVIDIEYLYDDAYYNIYKPFTFILSTSYIKRYAPYIFSRIQFNNDNSIINSSSHISSHIPSHISSPITSPSVGIITSPASRKLNSNATHVINSPNTKKLNTMSLPQHPYKRKIINTLL